MTYGLASCWWQPKKPHTTIFAVSFISQTLTYSIHQIGLKAQIIVLWTSCKMLRFLQSRTYGLLNKIVSDTEGIHNTICDSFVHKYRVHDSISRLIVGKHDMRLIYFQIFLFYFWMKSKPLNDRYIRSSIHHNIRKHIIKYS